MIAPSPERGLLISHLHDQFWSSRYRDAAELVRSWRAERGPTWAAEFFRLWAERDTLAKTERKVVERTNKARRLIKSYFRKTQQLCSRGFLTEEDLCEHLTMPQRLELLFQVIEPLERARKAGYKREMFDFYDRIHDRALDRPER